MLLSVRRTDLSCLSLVLMIALTGCRKVIKFTHSPAMAARRAEQFANTAFIERNLTAAYGLMSENGKSSLPFERFQDVVLKMHESNYPASIAAVEYEPILGQKEMNIYLLGEARDEKLYYRFVMEGTQETDYKVAGFWRNDGPYPPADSVKRLNR